VTVRETIVTVSAQNSASPSSTSDDPVTFAPPPLETFHSAAHKLRNDRGIEEPKTGLGTT